MTLPLLLGIELAHQTTVSITLGLAGGVVFAIVTFTAWCVREHQRGVERDKQIATLSALLSGDSGRITRLEVSDARKDERLDQLFSMLGRIEAKLDRLTEPQHTK